MNFSLFHFSGPKDNFHIKTHPKLSNFPPTLFSRYKKIKPVNPKRNSKYSLEGLILKLKLQYYGHPMQRANSLEKTLMLGKIEGRRRRGPQRKKWLDNITDNIHEFERILGDSEGQGSLVRKSPRVCTELDTT